MKKYNELKAEIVLDFYIDEICKFQDVKKTDVLSKNRKREFADIRAMAAYFAKTKFPDLKSKSISEYFKLKGHAAALHSVNKIEVLKNSVAKIRITLEHCESLDFVDGVLQSNGFDRDCLGYKKEMTWKHLIIDFVDMKTGGDACNFGCGGGMFFYIKNINIFDALIIAKNIDSNPLGTIINSLKK